MQFQQDWPKDEKITALLIFLPENLEKYRSTEHYGAINNFSLSQLFGQYGNGKLSISEA